MERIAAAAEARARDRAVRATTAAVESSRGVSQAGYDRESEDGTIQFRPRQQRRHMHDDDAEIRGRQASSADQTQRSSINAGIVPYQGRGMAKSGRARPRDEDRDASRSLALAGEIPQYFDGLDDAERTSMLKSIRSDYLGGKERRPAAAAAKKKNPRDFTADWDPTDDTSQDVNPLYQTRFERDGSKAGAGGVLSSAQGGAAVPYHPGMLAAESLAAKARVTARARARTGLPPWMQAALPPNPAAPTIKSQAGHQAATSRGAVSSSSASATSRASREMGAAAAHVDARPIPVASAVLGSKGGQARGSRSRRLAVLAEGDEVHWSAKRPEDMTERDWRILREDYDIHFKGRNPPRPLRSWAEACLEPSLMRAIDEMGYKEPSPIQRATVPAGMSHRDLMGIAETGSGKTAAFLLPMLHLILTGDPARRAACRTHGPLALILAPTRELAQQIEQETAKLCKFARVSSTCLVGGENIDEQAQALRRGVEVLVATPGRLVECLQSSLVVFNQCNYVVLDEADTMIDFGFEPQVTQILEVMAEHGSTTPGDGTATAVAVAATTTASTASSASSSSSATTAGKERTTIMFSATMPPAVERIALRFMRGTLKVRIGDDDSVKNQRISQDVIYTAENGKRKLLAAALQHRLRPAIVFVNTKKNCEAVARHITDLGNSCIVLHGDKEQADRAAALADFKAGRVEVLVATDVAGRGLDIPDVAQVINYDLPSDIQRYTHRIGRTGRAGKEGASVSFFTDDDEKILPALRSHLLATGQRVPLQLDRHPAVAASALG